MNPMGNCFTPLFSKCEFLKVLMVGPGGSGKTTLLHRWYTGEVINTEPTLGFNTETIKHRGVSFTVWDLGGQDKMRPLWKLYFQRTLALIFVVDSTDREKLVVSSTTVVNTSDNDDEHELVCRSAAEELKLMMENEELQNVPLLVLANKQDLPEALPVQEIEEMLNLKVICNSKRRWHIQGVSATSGDGLDEAMDRLIQVTRFN
jgi:small GTP-binding protein